MPTSLMTPVQWTVLFVFILALILEIYYSIKSPERRHISYALMTWFVHGIIFYSVDAMNVDLSMFGTGPYGYWSSILRLHGIIIITSITIYRLIHNKES